MLKDWSVKYQNNKKTNKKAHEIYQSLSKEGKEKKVIIWLRMILKSTKH